MNAILMEFGVDIHHATTQSLLFWSLIGHLGSYEPLFFSNYFENLIDLYLQLTKIATYLWLHKPTNLLVNDPCKTSRSGDVKKYSLTFESIAKIWMTLPD